MAFDDEALKRLRARYGEGHGGNIHDPEFRAVADRIFSASGTRAAPYSGIPTLLDAVYRPVGAIQPDLSDLHVALIGVPTDLAISEHRKPVTQAYCCRKPHRPFSQRCVEMAFRASTGGTTLSTLAALCEEPNHAWML